MDTIGLVRVHLVGCLSVKRVVGHLGIVLPDVEIDATTAPGLAVLPMNRRLLE